MNTTYHNKMLKHLNDNETYRKIPKDTTQQRNVVIIKELSFNILHNQKPNN